MSVRVIIADNNELTREGLIAAVNRDPEIELAGVCPNSRDLLQQINLLQPQVVLIDYSFKEFTIDIIPEITRLYPRTKVVAITGNQTGLSIAIAIKSGILGYVTKNCDLKEITDSIKATARGDRFFCGTILQTIQDESIDIHSGEYKSFTCAPITLSEREMEIITLIAEGYTNAQIAEKLFLSTHTVNTHRKNIMSKLGVNNTAGIVMYAVKANLVSPNEYIYAGQS